MKLQDQTLILSTPLLFIPSGDVIPMIKNLISNKQCNIDYFGGELDHQVDFIDEEMAEKIEATTYITFHFQSEEINHTMLTTSEIYELILNSLDSEIQDVIVTKDIEIYLN